MKIISWVLGGSETVGGLGRLDFFKSFCVKPTIYHSTTGNSVTIIAFKYARRWSPIKRSHVFSSDPLDTEGCNIAGLPYFVTSEASDTI